METVFHKAVARILDSWTSLQMAIQRGCEGAATSEKARWLVDAVDQWMTENKNVEPYELEDTLLQILNADFDLQLQDESEVQIAKDIVECFELCQKGKDVSKFLNLSKVSAEQLAQALRIAECSSSDDDDDDDDVQDPVPQLVPIVQMPKAARSHSDKNSDTAIDANKASTSHSSATPDKELSEMAMEEDDEWTTVVRHKKR